MDLEGYIEEHALRLGITVEEAWEIYYANLRDEWNPALWELAPGDV